jgi:DNA polymerase III gamma/tau subunit
MLYQKMRPTNLDEVVGNNTTIIAIKKMLQQTDKPHAIIIHGPTGCGKTTIARIMAAELGCKPENFIELNAANTRGIETIRTIAEEAHTFGMGGGNKIYMLDESHQLTKDSQEAILKILEDCPEHCYFIMCTTEPNSLIKTIRNRCTEYEMGQLGKVEIVELLERICATSSFDVSKDVIEAISYTCDGCPRAAVVSLEQVLNIDNIDEALELLVKGTENDANVIDLCKLLVMRPDIRVKKWKQIITTFDTIQMDSEIIRKSALTFIYNRLKNIDADDIDMAKYMVDILDILSQSTFYGGKSLLGAMIAKICFIGA